MHNRQMPLVVQRLESGQRRMQPEESVEIHHLLLGNRNAWSHRVVILLAVRHHNVESIGRAALEDHHQPAIRRQRALRHPTLCNHGAHQELRNSRCSGQRQRALVKKEAAIDLHKSTPPPKSVILNEAFSAEPKDLLLSLPLLLSLLLFSLFAPHPKNLSS